MEILSGKTAKICWCYIFWPKMLSIASSSLLKITSFPDIATVDFNKKLTFVIVGYEQNTIITNPRFQW